MVGPRERNNVVEGGRKNTDVRSRVDSVFLGSSSEVSRYPGSSNESPGDWHSVPLEDGKGQKRPNS
jgi:hypothetical protein